MAQRATGFAKRPASAKTNRVSDTMRAMDGEPAALRAIPLNLAPLVAPYKKQGRLTLRIERLYHLGRLSAGRNNGDGSWSLSTDELEDLEYLLPESMEETHTLAVRIMTLDDGAGTTLAVLDYLVSPATGESGAARNGAVNGSGNGSGNGSDASVPGLDIQAQFQRLRDELAKANADLAAREAELIRAKQAAERPEPQPPITAESIKAAIAKTRASWESEVAERIEAAKTAARAEFEADRATWEEEQKQRAARVEAKAQERQEEARGLWQRVMQEALVKAEEEWKAGEASRLASAEAKWKEASAQAIAQAHAESASRAQNEESELRRLQAEIAGLHNTLADRDSALGRAVLDAENARQQAQRDVQNVLVKAEEKWKTAEATRFAAAEAQWNENLAKALTQARSEAAARAKGDENELRRANEDLEALRARLAERESALAERDSALARAIADAAKAGEQARQEAQDALAKAAEAWKANEAARLAVAEASWGASEATRFAEAELRWRETSAKAVAEARDESKAARSRSDESELQRLRDETDVLRANLAERETALARGALETVQIRERVQREAQDALLKAEQKWRADETERLAAAEKIWRETASGPISEAASRLAAAEAALAQLREASKNVTPSDDGEVARLRAELATAQAAITERDVALTQTRLAGDKARDGWRQEMQATLTREKAAWVSETEAKLAAAEAQWRLQSATQLAETTTRCEAAERALSRIRLESQRDHQNDADVSRMRGEIFAMQTALAEREAELAETHAALARLHDRQESESKITLRPARAWNTADTQEVEAPRKSNFMRDIIIAGSVTVALVVAYPVVDPYLPDSVRNTIANATGSMFGAPPAPVEVAAPAPVQPPALPTALVIRDVNLRAGASTDTGVVVTLRRDTRVSVVDRREAWTRVRVGGVNGAAPKEGWVFNTFLQDEVAPMPVAPAPVAPVPAAPVAPAAMAPARAAAPIAPAAAQPAPAAVYVPTPGPAAVFVPPPQVPAPVVTPPVPAPVEVQAVTPPPEPALEPAPEAVPTPETLQ